MTDATTIPCLPCVSMAESLTFYRALGLEVTYQQRSPDAYAGIRQGRCELHLFGLKGLPECHDHPLRVAAVRVTVRVRTGRAAVSPVRLLTPEDCYGESTGRQLGGWGVTKRSGSGRCP